MGAGAARIFSGDREFISLVRDALVPLHLRFLQPNPDSTTRGESSGEVRVAGEECQADVLLVDYEWKGDADSRYQEVGERSLAEMRRLFSDQNSLSPALRVLKEQSDCAAEELHSGSVAILFVEDPSLPFMQFALELGATWVWPSRKTMSRLGEVVARLRQLQSPADDEDRPRPNLMVIEDAPDDIRALRAALDDGFALAFVGVDEKPANALSVSPDEAISFFQTRGPFDGIILDLALSAHEDAQARNDYGSYETGVLAFIREAPASQQVTLSEMLSGLTILAWLLDQHLDFPVFVISNWVRNPAVFNQIGILFAAGIRDRRVEFFDKQDKGLDELRAALLGSTGQP
jgi:uncharacterized protein YukE/CheY-like chemotaxis protein